MRIVEIYSHLNGIEFLSIRCPSLLQEIKDRIEGLDISDCAHTDSSSKRSFATRTTFANIHKRRTQQSVRRIRLEKTIGEVLGS